MIRPFTLSAIVLAALQAHGQEAQLPSSLTTAAKESLQKIEEQKQHDIIFYAKNNKPQQDTSSQAPANEADFYRLYMKDEDNRYYNNYHDNNTDPIITAMPSPGPNLDYFFVDPCSSGNYDKVVKQ
ncbi:hypothetical protein OGH69_01070 [Flavobacterium sp. MFBS3-15]|uniref:hypothetical protein n=1 Tax=Flavobacterium sp. MFBS3-15 TaxID=2989816 RepID=UPI002235A762|nr:hypothetical protein [Flavobacterium sp. MFBS3-15]MCW4467546.1 hypothetical protein [Flavobacterium sp. MFBS3-15]